MENITIEGGDYIPKICINLNQGVIEISGEAYDYYSNAINHTQPILDCLNKYLKKYSGKFSVNFKITYINEGYLRRFSELIKVMESYEENKIIINWYYEEGDEEYKKEGEDLSKASNLEFNLIPYQENS